MITPAPIVNKPDAVKVLRDYLRICTPYGIKISVNTFSRSKATGATLLEDREIEVLRELLRASLITHVETPLGDALGAPERPRTSDSPAILNDFELHILVTDVKQMQRIFCLQETGTTRLKRKPGR